MTTLREQNVAAGGPLTPARLTPDPTVTCAHCAGAGSLAGSACCFMAQGTVPSLREAVKLATANPQMLLRCCSCEGTGRVNPK